MSTRIHITAPGLIHSFHSFAAALGQFLCHSCALLVRVARRECVHSHLQSLTPSCAHLLIPAALALMQSEGGSDLISLPQVAGA
jgi:hypothetical protein